MTELWAVELTDEGDTVRVTCLRGPSALRPGQDGYGNLATAIRRVQTALRNDPKAVENGAWFRLRNPGNRHPA